MESEPPPLPEVPPAEPVKKKHPGGRPKGVKETKPRKVSAERRRIDAAREHKKKVDFRDAHDPFPPESRPGARMRYVMERFAANDLTPVEKNLRQWYGKDAMEYQREMLRLEAEEAKPKAAEPDAAAVPAAPADKPEPDEATARLVALCDELIARANAGAV